MRKPGTLLLLVTLAGACGVEVISREPRPPTPVRVLQVEPDPSATEGDGTPKEGAGSGETVEAPVQVAGLSAQALPAPTRKGVVLDVIRAATQSLDAGLYLITDTTIAQALVDARNRQVEVRVVIDDSQHTSQANTTALNMLESAGIAVTRPQAFTYHHAKYLIADGKVALIMTCNFSNSSFNDNREVVVRVTDLGLLSELQTIFNADFDGVEPPLSEDTRLVVSPVNTRDKLAGLIGNAASRIIVAMQSVDDNETVYQLIERHQAGVEVRVMIADPSVYGKSGDAQWLKDRGIAVRYLPVSLLYLHEKVIIADDASFVGSVNLTYTSITQNREIGVIGDQTLTTTVLPQVEADWDAAVPF